MSHGGKRPGSGAKPKGAAGKNMSLRLYKSNRDMLAKWRERYNIESDAAAVRHMMFVAVMAVDAYGTLGATGFGRKVDGIELVSGDRMVIPLGPSGGGIYTWDESAGNS